MPSVRAAFYSWGVALGKGAFGEALTCAQSIWIFALCRGIQVMNFVPDVVREPDTAMWCLIPAISREPFRYS